MIFVLIGVGVPIVNAQSTGDFTISSFDVDYYLDKDNEGRSTLKTIEKITAVFPARNQNHGIERAIPVSYDGHKTNLNVISVTDTASKEVHFSKRTDDNGNLVLRIGDADKYVHGPVTYVITYTQRDVTKFFDSTNDDELYWDVNGTDWAQAMDEVSARVHISPSLGTSLNHKASCYKGAQGSTDTCSLVRTDTDGIVYAARIEHIRPYENMTFAIGFAPHTFVPYQLTTAERILATLKSVWLAALPVSTIITLIIIIILIVRYVHVMERVKGKGTVVPEYLPPKNASVLLSGVIEKNQTSDMTAQLIDLAVRHYIKIYQTKEKSLFSAAEYTLEVIKNPSDLRKEEFRLLTTLFGKKNLKAGDRFSMSTLKNNTDMAKKLLENRKKLKNESRGLLGMYERAEKEAEQFRKWGVILLVIAVLTLLPPLFFALLFAFIFWYRLWPLTENGVELRDYLKGLRLYISVAEEERIKMLQSPEGAEKIGLEIEKGKTAELIKLYERVLPYAVLFGIEKEWTKQLGAYYELNGSQPDWYTGNAAFNAVYFSSALNGFSSQASSYSSAYSSSSGGADGGGASGGGGGGGGGGGW